MFLISKTQVITETNYGLLTEISGGFPRQHCGPLNVGKTPLLTLTKKLFYHSNRTKCLDCPHIYPYFKNYSEIPVFRGGNWRLKVRSIDLALWRQDVCPQPRGDSPSPQISRELLRRPMADPDTPGPPPGSLCREIVVLSVGPYTGKGVQEECDLLTPGPNQRG